MRVRARRQRIAATALGFLRGREALEIRIVDSQVQKSQLHSGEQPSQQFMFSALGSHIFMDVNRQLQNKGQQRVTLVKLVDLRGKQLSQGLTVYFGSFVIFSELDILQSIFVTHP